MLPPEPNYKNIKLLGTKLGAKKDITARKKQSMTATAKNESFLQFEKTQQPSQDQDLYIETTLLYNTETWSLTATLENSLSVFHR